MKFSLKNPLNGLKDQDHKLFDCHVHIWNRWFFKELLTYMKIYNVVRMVGFVQPKVQKNLEKMGLTENIIFSYFLSIKAFATFDIATLLRQIDEA